MVCRVCIHEGKGQLREQVLTGKFESINEETISETHLKIVQESDWEGNLGPAVIEPRHVLSEEDTHYRSNYIIHS